MDLFPGMKPSQILAQLESGVSEGFLSCEGPGRYCFSDDKKRLKWKGKLPAGDELEIHGFIADVLMRELPDTDEKAKTVAHTYLGYYPKGLYRLKLKQLVN